MGFTPEVEPQDAPSGLNDAAGNKWTPLFKHGCSFPPEVFREVMLNLIRNPNINSNHLFRADISVDVPYIPGFENEESHPARITHFEDYVLKSIMVRTLVPRNTNVHKTLEQTCLLYDGATDADTGKVRSLVTYIPHVSSPSESPFYHPAVHGIAFLHSFDPQTREGVVSIQYCFFDTEERSATLERTAHHLLASVHKHGQGKAAGYVKRVQHDVLLPQAVVQNTYARLKSKYARSLIESWAETTDPGKHVFEDLNIAAFLIELWATMYQDKGFPGFVDIGCGNGLLVHILIEEGYSGWGFDARRRKSWATYGHKTQDNLKEMVLIPDIIQSNSSNAEHFDQTTKLQDSQEFANTAEAIRSELMQNTFESLDGSAPQSPEIKSQNDISLSPTESIETRIHNGLFPSKSFIISNHADELTPWTPILANLSQSPFMMIPCCSHSLNGARFRAPPPNKTGVSNSAYSSLVAWVTSIAQNCGWQVETEMLRIPSTRNTALIGRYRSFSFDEVDVVKLVDAFGGAAGWVENAMMLVKGSTRGH